MLKGSGVGAANIAAMATFLAACPPSQSHVTPKDPKVADAMQVCAMGTSYVRAAALKAEVDVQKKSGKAGIELATTYEAEILKYVPPDKVAEVYASYVECLDKRLEKVGLTAVVSVSIPAGWTLRQAINIIAQSEKAVPQYEVTCATDFLDATLSTVQLQAISATRLFELLPDKLDKQRPMSLQARASEPGVYAISCRM